MKKPQIPYISRSVNFSTDNLTIDYFKIPVDVLKADKFTVSHKMVELKADEMLSVKEHFATLDSAENETVVLNIQVGKGKTTSCYELIEQYSKQGYKIIVASPFKKLVEKDYAELKKRKLSIFHYGELTDDIETNFDKYIDCNVQVMTINCLLQNPGDDAYTQRFIKKNYLDQLYLKCQQEKKKVVIFFDEIHESIHNFHRQYIPNLYRWHNVIHKCFVASATFTPASVPVLKYIGALTNCKINVYETPRQKISIPSNLHLHFIQDAYSGNNINPLIKLKEIIAQNKGKRINILTGYKSIANALVDTNNSENEIVQSVLSLNPNITSGDDDIPFDKTRNNIGTTFKTGVDILEPDSILIVIHPFISEGKSYGIFSDGLPSLLQSVARIRGTGHVHIMTSVPSVNMNNEKSFRLSNNPIFDIKNMEYTAQNELYDKLYQQYTKQKQERINEINALTKLQNIKVTLNYNYPSFEEYLIDSSQNLLVKIHYEYGKELSPYTLWASLNNQFTNTKLTEMTHTYRKRTIVKIDKQNIVQNIKKFVSNELLSEAVKLPLSKAVYYIVEHIGNNIDEDLKFEYKGKPYSAKELQTFPFFMQTIANLYVQRVCNTDTLIKEDYILGATLQVAKQTDSKINSLSRDYYKLYKCRNYFLKFITGNIEKNGKGENIIHRDLYEKIPERWYKYFSNVLSRINKQDKLIKNKTYKLYNADDEQEITKQMKESIYKECEKCFTNITGKKRSINGKKEEYYLIEGSIERQLPKELASIQFV